MIRKIMLGMALLCLGAFTTRAATMDGFAEVVNGDPNSPSYDLLYLNAAITAYGHQADGTQLDGFTGQTYYQLGGAAPGSTLASTVGSFRIDTPLSATFSLNASVDYIVAHFGAQGGGADIMYNFATEVPGDYTLNAPADLGGISSITFFGDGLGQTPGTTLPPEGGSSVPDGGATLAMLGTGLCGLYTVGKRKLTK